jgi:hypothetical protein
VEPARQGDRSSVFPSPSRLAAAGVRPGSFHELSSWTCRGAPGQRCGVPVASLAGGMPAASRRRHARICAISRGGRGQNADRFALGRHSPHVTFHRRRIAALPPGCGGSSPRRALRCCPLEPDTAPNFLGRSSHSAFYLSRGIDGSAGFGRYSKE